MYEHRTSCHVHPISSLIGHPLSPTDALLEDATLIVHASCHVHLVLSQSVFLSHCVPIAYWKSSRLGDRRSLWCKWKWKYIAIEDVEYVLKYYNTYQFTSIH